MFRRGHCLRNAAMESFSTVVRREWLYLRKFSSTRELRIECMHCIRYNNRH
ncbi:transposase InsO family protein [Comamonas sp. BIGb0152]|nr:transposase InsO family protein [Comamonas sp. BIGb0152]